MLITVQRSVFTKSFSRILAIVERMASPEGTTIERLTKHFSITRWHVFRLIRIIEHEFHIPVIKKRKSFGGETVYRLPKTFIDSLSRIEISSVPLSFKERMIIYLLAKSGTLPALL